MVKKDNKLKPVVKGTIFDERIKKHLTTPPMRIGYTSVEVAEALGEPVSTTKMHLDLLDARGLVEFECVGKAKIYKLKSKTESTTQP